MGDKAPICSQCSYKNLCKFPLEFDVWCFVKLNKKGRFYYQQKERLAFKICFVPIKTINLVSTMTMTISLNHFTTRVAKADH